MGLAMVWLGSSLSADGVETGFARRRVRVRPESGQGADRVEPRCAVGQARERPRSFSFFVLFLVLCGSGSEARGFENENDYEKENECSGEKKRPGALDAPGRQAKPPLLRGRQSRRSRSAVDSVVCGPVGLRSAGPRRVGVTCARWRSSGRLRCRVRRYRGLRVLPRG